MSRTFGHQLLGIKLNVLFNKNTRLKEEKTKLKTRK